MSHTLQTMYWFGNHIYCFLCPSLLQASLQSHNSSILIDTSLFPYCLQIIEIKLEKAIFLRLIEQGVTVLVLFDLLY